MYSLLIWTIVGYAGTQMNTWEKRDWRPLIDNITRSVDGTTAEQNCHRAARELGLKPEAYRCVRIN